MTGRTPENGETVRVVKRLGGAGSSGEDVVLVEEPLEIRVDGGAVAVTMRTPGDDVDLAAGFCLTEGIVGSGAEIDVVEPCTEADYGNIVGVRLTAEAGVLRREAIERARRELLMSSSCGLCAKQTIDQVRQRVEPLEATWAVEADALSGMVAAMRERQTMFEKTGGSHGAAVFDAGGALRVAREDVGRHNAVDKAIGRLLLREEEIGDGVLVVSGRAGFEIVQKAAVARLSVVCAVGAPSSMAVDLAEGLGLTLIGFLRDSRMNVYSRPDRVVG
ncbi:MAG: formate dehydrogenase accessory sulfurtransferase FdhD [Planctomycetota bacterium]